jgi:hypothetical protein
MLFKVKDEADAAGSAEFRKACRFSLKGIEAARSAFFDQDGPDVLDGVDRGLVFGALLHAAHALARVGRPAGSDPEDLLEKIGPVEPGTVESGFLGAMIAQRATRRDPATSREVISALSVIPGFDGPAAETGAPQGEAALAALRAVHPTLRVLAFEIRKPYAAFESLEAIGADVRAVPDVWRDYEAATFRGIDRARLADAMRSGVSGREATRAPGFEP